MPGRKSSFDKEGLLACARGELFGPGNAQLPAPPMLMIHGTRDALIPIEAARPFAERLGEVSSSAAIWVELEGAQHAFDIFPSHRTVRTIEYVERFLDAVHRGVIK